jgi:hypothetical protein
VLIVFSLGLGGTAGVASAKKLLGFYTVEGDMVEACAPPLPGKPGEEDCVNLATSVAVCDFQDEVVGGGYKIFEKHPLVVDVLHEVLENRPVDERTWAVGIWGPSMIRTENWDRPELVSQQTVAVLKMFP